jgi:multiple sugar transport system substrate-binding protein
MMINKSLFDKAGTANLLPQNKGRTWTFDEYYNAIKTTQDKLSGVYGTACTGALFTGDAFTLQWIWGAGGSLIADSMDKIVVNEPKAIRGLKFWKKLIDDGLQAPGGATVPIGNLYPLFNQQKVLTVLCATTQYARTKLAMKSGDALTFEIMLAMPPTFDGKPVTSSFPHGFAVPVQDDPQIEKYAVLFAKFLGGAENAKAVAASNEFSYQKNTEDIYAASGDENLVFATSAMQYIRGNGTAAVGYNPLRQGLTPELQKLYAGTITVEQFAAYAETEGNKILAQAKRDLGK